jgi:phage terminase large subunit
MPNQTTRTDAISIYGVAEWFQRLAEDSNDVFLPLFMDTHRYLVLKGGGGSGKSIFAGRKIIERCISERRHRILVCRKVAKTLRESCFQQLRQQLAEAYPDIPVQINQSDMTISFPHNNSKILFAGLDDVEKLKSIYNITSIWIEEASELLETDFDQLDIRLRGETQYYKQIILSFNPVSVMHWLKRRFFDTPNKKVRISETTYKDNRFLDDEAKAVLEGFKDSDPYYYEVYCLGQWGTTGRSVFNAKAVAARLAEDIQPVRIGRFEYDDDGLSISSIHWVDDPDGEIRMYAEPEAGAPYVIGGDTAGDGSDAFVGQVLDNRTGAQVCVLRHTFDEDVYTKQMFCLGIWYNQALIGIETNLSTYPTRELQRLHYPRQYVRETEDSYTHKPKASYGFKTTAQTRPIILAELIAAVREDISLVCDKATLEEMLTFVRNEDYRAEAEEGAHDDTIMALAIAHHIRPQQRYESEQEEQTVKWTKGMWEDYRNASRDEKAYLIQMWGKPRR